MAGEDRSGELRGVVTFSLIIGTTSTLMRIYSRGKLAKIWKIEDWIMIVATLLFICNHTTSLLTIKYGAGRHMADLEPENMELALMCWWLCFPTFALAMSVCKCSVGIFLNRITPNRIHHWIMWISMGINLAFGIMFAFLTIFQCSPVDYWWKRFRYPEMQGQCISLAVIMNVTYAFSSVAIITDFIFALLPIHIVMGLQMSMRIKLVLVPIFLLAILAAIACAVRLAYLPLFLKSDFLWDTSDIVIWSQLEAGLGITAGNLATLRPLLRLVMQRLHLWTGHTSSRYDNTSGMPHTGDRAGGKNSHLNPFSQKSAKHSFSKVIEVQTDLDITRDERDVGTMDDELVRKYHDPDEFGKINGLGTAPSNRSGTSSVNENGGDDAIQLEKMPRVTYSALN